MFVEGGLHPEQVKALRAMSLQKRLDLTLGAIASMRNLRAAVLRTEHPDWTLARVKEQLREEMRNAGR